MSKTLGPTATVLAAFLLLVTWTVPVFAASVTMTPAGDLSLQTELEAMERRATNEPNNPESWYTLAKYCSDKAQNDAKLSRDMAQKYVMRGLEVDDRALLLNPVYYEALTLKDVLLRQRAGFEKDPAVRKNLIAEADAIRAKAAKLLKEAGRKN
jgi:hypothetical protein